MTQLLAFPKLFDATQLPITPPSDPGTADGFQQRLDQEIQSAPTQTQPDSASARDVRTDRDESAHPESREETQTETSQLNARETEGASESLDDSDRTDTDTTETEDSGEMANADQAESAGAGVLDVETQAEATDGVAVETSSLTGLLEAPVAKAQATPGAGQAVDGEKVPLLTTQDVEVAGGAKSAAIRSASVEATATTAAAHGDENTGGEQPGAGQGQSQRNASESAAGGAMRPPTSESSAPTDEPRGASLATEATQLSQQQDAGGKDGEAAVRTTTLSPNEAPTPRATGAAERPTLMSSAGARAESGAIRAEVVDDRASVVSAQRGLAAAVRQNGGSITIKMVPETLGALRIQLSINGGSVDVQFEATTEQAREILHRNIESLRQSLTSKGLGVERMQVNLHPSAQESHDGRNSGERQGGQEQQRQHSGGDERSRGFHERHGGGDRPEQQWKQTPNGFESAWRVAVNTTA